MRMPIILALLALLALAPSRGAAQQPSLVATADSVFAPWNSTHTPGCAVGISRGGQVLLTRAYGMADLEANAPNTPETIFESGSVAKQFTATAVLLLAQDGKLRLDDEVQKYLPEMPRYERPITIRNLLTHTSGLREWSSLVAWSGWARGSRAHTQADLLDIVYRQKALNYPVGDYYSYTNSDYAIAMSLVERVSGKSFQEFTRERIFKPLGMTRTQWRDDFTRLVPGRAQAYSRSDSEWHLEMPFENVVGPGGMLTTVGDWLIWNNAISKSTLAAGLRDSLEHRMHLTTGREIEYALGLFVQNYRGIREVSHSGSTAGYSTYLARFPDRGDLSIAVLCNSASAAPDGYVHQLADRMIGDFPVAVTTDTARVDSAALSRFFGIYRNTRTHQTNVINTESMPRLRASSGGWYVTPTGSRWRFETRGDSTPARLTVAQASGDTIQYTFMTRVAWMPTAQQLRELEGTYRSEELGATFRVQARGDSLTVAIRPGEAITMRPTYSDAFTARGTAVRVSVGVFSA